MCGAYLFNSRPVGLRLALFTQARQNGIAKIGRKKKPINDMSSKAKQNKTFSADLIHPSQIELP